MQEQDKAQFEEQLGMIFAALDKPLTDTKRDAFWQGCRKMSLADFTRVRIALLTKLESGEVPKALTVADIWAAKRNLRAMGPDEARGWIEAPDFREEIGRGDDFDHPHVQAKLRAYLEKLTANDDAKRKAEFSAAFWVSARGYFERQKGAPPQDSRGKPWTGDVWDEAANRHLFAYVARKSLSGGTKYNADQTRVLVKYKNAWAQDMREGASDLGEVAIETQKAAWADCMQRAEADIARKLAA